MSDFAENVSNRDPRLNKPNSTLSDLREIMGGCIVDVFSIPIYSCSNPQRGMSRRSDAFGHFCEGLEQILSMQETLLNGTMSYCR